MFNMISILDLMKEKDFIVMPYHWQQSKCYSITIEGYENFTLHNNDTKFMDLLTFTAKIVDCFVSQHKDNFVFSTPQFILKPNGTCIVKLATLEKEEYNKRVEKEEANDGSIRD